MPNDDLISREEAVKMLREKANEYKVSMFTTSEDCYIAKVVATECAAEIRNLPAVDAEPVRHGRWRKHGNADIWRCTKCGKHSGYPESYCPNCGAKMEKEDEG